MSGARERGSPLRGGPFFPQESPLLVEGVLELRYHVPSEKKWTGNVHLHVLGDIKLGRRIRLEGECLCSKKHGSDETTVIPDSVYVCVECRKVADENGLAWSAPWDRKGVPNG